MDVKGRIEEALRAKPRLSALDALVRQLSMARMAKKAIAEMFYEAYKQKQAENRFEEADALADILDYLTGYCAKNMRLLPDDPDVDL